MEIATEMETPDRNTCDLKNGNKRETPEQPQVHRVTRDLPKQSETAAKGSETMEERTLSL